MHFLSWESIDLNSRIRAEDIVLIIKQRFAIPRIAYWLATPSHHPVYGCQFSGLASRATGLPE
jgi:hypothetical protein